MTEAGWTRKCVESVWTGLGNGHGFSRQCGRTGKVQHEGRWYCGMHSPEAKAKRKAKSDAHYQQYREKMDAKYAREDFDRRAGDALRAMNITDPQTLTDSYQQGRVAGLVRGAQLVRWHKSCAFEADPALALERAAKDIESVASQIIQPQQAQDEKGVGDANIKMS